MADSIIFGASGEEEQGGVGSEDQINLLMNTVDLSKNPLLILEIH